MAATLATGETSRSGQGGASTTAGSTARATFLSPDEPSVLFAAVRAFIARRVSDRMDAEDVAQEALLRIYQKIGELRDAAAFECWAFRVARNAVTDYYRYRTRRPVPIDLVELSGDGAEGMAIAGLLAGGGVAEMVTAGPDDDPADGADELAALVPYALGRLPAAYREALELTDLGGMSQDRAAARLGLSASGLKSRVQRGRRLLRAELAQCRQAGAGVLPVGAAARRPGLLRAAG